MGQRIKVSGYVMVADFGDGDVDLAHPTGLTSQGQENLFEEFKIQDLEDLDMELEK